MWGKENSSGRRNGYLDWVIEEGSLVKVPLPYGDVSVQFPLSCLLSSDKESMRSSHRSLSQHVV